MRTPCCAVVKARQRLVVMATSVPDVQAAAFGAAKSSENAAVSVGGHAGPHVRVTGEQTSPGQCPSFRHSTHCELVPCARQCGVAPPHGAHAAPHWVVVSQGTHTLPSHEEPAAHVAHVAPQFAFVVQGTQTLLLHRCPAPQSPVPTHCTHCPALQMLPVTVQSVQDAPQRWLVVQAAQVPPEQ